MMSRGSLVKLGVAPVAALAIGVACAVHRPFMNDLYVRWGLYWFTLLVAYLGWVLRRDLPRKSLLPTARWALMALAAAVLVFWSVGPQLRVVSDETNNIGAARTMAEEHRLLNATQLVFHADTVTPLGYSISDRPLLHPWTLAVIDMATGYRLANAYALNFILLWAVLAYVGTFAERRLGFGGAVGLALLLLAQPLLPLCAASGGYDLMATALLVAAAMALVKHWESPGPGTLVMLWVALVGALHVRHENAILLPVMFGGLLVVRRLAWRDVVPRLGVYLATPLVLLPRAVGLALYADMLSPQHQISVNEPSVSLASLRGNLISLGDAFHRFDLFPPFATVLNLAGLAAFVWLLGERRSRSFMLVAGAAVAAQVLVVCSYWGGDARSTLAARYFLPMSLALAALPAVVLARLPGRWRSAAPAAGLAFYLFYFPVAVRATFANSEPSIRKLNFMYRLLGDQQKDGLLVVTDFPGRYTVHDYSAITFDYFASHVAWVKEQLATHAFRDVWIVQDIDLGTGTPTRRTALTIQGLKLEDVAKYRSTDHIVVTVRKLVL